MIGVEGLSLSALELELLAHPRVSGVILFTRNYHDKPQLAALTAAIKQSRQDLLIAVDCEGGRVQRFRKGFTELPSFADLAACYQRDAAQGLAAIAHSASTMVSELREIGVDFSFTPVLDVDVGISEVIASRSFGADPALVAKLGGYLIDCVQALGMPCVAKHFPGHGGVAADTHLEQVADSRSFAELQQQDLVPFQAVCQRVAAVMLAHVVYPEIDSAPASMSRFWMQTVLREQLGFAGVIVSDDLMMAGVGTDVSVGDCTAQAFDAGCDLALICNDSQLVGQVLDGLSAQSAKMTLDRLDSLRMEAA